MMINPIADTLEAAFRAVLKANEKAHWNRIWNQMVDYAEDEIHFVVRDIKETQA